MDKHKYLVLIFLNVFVIISYTLDPKFPSKCQSHISLNTFKAQTGFTFVTFV